MSVIKTFKEVYGVAEKNIEEHGLAEHLSNLDMNLLIISAIDEEKEKLKLMKFPICKLIYPF